MFRRGFRLTLLQVFSLVSLIGMLVMGFSLGQLVGQAVEEIATARARQELAEVVRNRNPFWLNLPPGAFRGVHVPTAAAANDWRQMGVRASTDFSWWDRQVATALAGLPIYQVKVWNTDGLVIWSDRADDIGYQAVDDQDLNAALGGEIRAQFTNLGKPENAGVDPSSRPADTAILELYMPLLAQDSFDILAVMEIYEAVPDLSEDIREQQQLVWTGLAVGLAGLYLLLVGLVAQAAGTIARLERLRELQRYFSPQVARAIAAGKAGPGAPLRRRGGRAVLQERLLSSGDLTVAFLDIRDFTRTSEHLPPELVIQMLDDYLGVVTRAVFAHGGSVDKFLGDGVLAVFGAPLPDADHPLHAVQAVQAIFTELLDLNRARVEIGQPAILIGAAVATGPAISGNIGSSQQLSFTVIGDTVNLGSRLVGMAAPGEVLITEATYDRVRAVPGILAPPWRIGLRQILSVRGRDAAATVYTLQLDVPATNGAAHDPGALVGERELVVQGS